MLNVTNILQQFPILQQEINGKPLVYLDSAATAQKPLCVLDAVRDYYLHSNAPVGRGVYALAATAESIYAAAREKARAFLNAKESTEIIFVPNTTFAVNLVATSFGGMELRTGDRVLISVMEHHSNLVPWQMACAAHGAHLDVIPISDEGVIDIAAYEKLLTPRTKIVAITHVSNVLGTINPIREMIAVAHAQSPRPIPVLVDGAQAVPHLRVDVQELDCDFYVFSGHKIYAPTGSGVLYAQRALLEKMPPYQAGGGMINKVSFERTTFAELPQKFEAGTLDVGAAIGLAAALDFVNAIGIDNIARHEGELLQYATAKLQEIPRLKIIGTAPNPNKAAVISFVFPDIHPHDVATILDSEGIAVRAGHHCAMPLMERLRLPATTRASFGVYNTKDDVDALARALVKTRQMFG